MKNKRLVLDQLDKTLSVFLPLEKVSMPRNGWIRAIRTALGMTGKQFAARLGASPPRVAVLERDEVLGGVSLTTMRKAAEALDCVFVYAIVPRTTLTDSVKRAAVALARERLGSVSHTMILEGQNLSNPEMEGILKDMVEELMQSMPKQLWDHSSNSGR